MLLYVWSRLANGTLSARREPEQRMIPGRLNTSGKSRFLTDIPGDIPGDRILPAVRGPRLFLVLFLALLTFPGTPMAAGAGTLFFLALLTFPGTPMAADAGAGSSTGMVSRQASRLEGRSRLDSAACLPARVALS